MNTVPDGAVAVTLSLAARRGGLLHVDIEFYKQKIINFVKWI